MPFLRSEVVAINGFWLLIYFDEAQNSQSCRQNQFKHEVKPAVFYGKLIVLAHLIAIINTIECFLIKKSQV